MDYTVELLIYYRYRSNNDVIKDRDTLANQNSSDTNMQSCKSIESPLAVPIDVRGSSNDKREPSESRVTGNFLSNLVTFLTAKLRIASLRRTREVYPLSFSKRIYTIWKNDP